MELVVRRFSNRRDTWHFRLRAQLGQPTVSGTVAAQIQRSSVYWPAYLPIVMQAVWPTHRSDSLSCSLVHLYGSTMHWRLLRAGFRDEFANMVEGDVIDVLRNWAKNVTCGTGSR